MFKLQAIGGTFVLLCLAVGSTASGQGLLTLEDAVRIGLEKNLDISIARMESRMSENNVSLGKAGFLPKLDLTAAQSRSVSNTKQQYSNNSVVEKSDAVSRTTNAGAGLTWTLFDGWAMFIGYKKLGASRDIGRLSLKAQIDNTVASIVDGYYEVVKQATLESVLKEAVSISEERFRLAEDNLRLGSGSRFDMLRAKVDLNADRSVLLQQEINVQNAKIALNRILGVPVDSEFSVADSMAVRPRMPFDSLAAALFERNPSFRIAEKDRVLAGLNVKNAESRWYPRLGLFANYNYGQTKNEVGFFKLNENLGRSAGLTLSFNLFNGGSDWIDLKNAKLAAKASAFDLENLRRSLEADLRKVYNGYVRSLDLLGIEADNLEIARETLDIAKERFRLGTYTPLELREAQNAYVSAGTRLLDARASVKSAENEMLRMTGGYVRE
jgi:outer membrane protein TolC